MAGDLLDAAALLEPVSAEAPCGPDLDLAGDPDFLQATGRIEGMLPSSFFVQDEEGNLQPFDRSRIEIAPALKEVGKLLRDTRDLRLLTLSCRLCALNRDMAGLSSQFEGIAALLRERWADVHPQADDGDFGLRMAIMQTLDDAPTVALPIQYMTLLDSRRVGPITYRAMMIANGEMAALNGEVALDKSAIERALAEADLDQIKATLARITAIREAADAIRIATIEGAGYENAVTFDRVSGLVTRMAATLEAVLVSRDPTATLTVAAGREEAVGDSPQGIQVVIRPAGPIRDVPQAGAALAAVGAYLRTREPSSPSEILVRQAEDLVGKSFVDVMRALVPNLAEEATIAIGADRAFQLTFGQLSALGEPRAADGEVPTDGAGPEAGAPDDEPPAAPPVPRVTTRREAVDILRQVATFYRVAEPSSPIPLLLERACSLADADFLSILKDVLPQLMRRDDG